MHPYDGIPELAGLATYREAAHIGYSVDENVRRLLRFHWAERRLMRILISHLTAEPVWEVKCALALHQWQCAEHVDALRRRVGEMRSPVPPLDAAPALAAAYRAQLDGANPLADHPTCRLVRVALLETEDAVRWGSAALAALEEAP